MIYTPHPDKYSQMPFRRCGKSGLKLPAISLGLWHNFGGIDTEENARSILRLAFDRGITHFDLANNYGPPAGSAEETFGRVLRSDFHSWRDHMVISTKAGYHMWEGPYGEWGSKKYLVASLDQSLKRMGLDYVDVFYHHRPDPETPLEETMATLDLVVRQGKALYAGISNYNAEETTEASRILRRLGTPFIIHQPKYSMLVRTPENGLLDVLEKEGIGCIAFSPLAQGLLTNRYLDEIPADSRAAKSWGFLQQEEITPGLLLKIKALSGIAHRRDQTLAQMAIAWLLKKPGVTSVLVGASKPGQLEDSLKSLENLRFAGEELGQIEKILND